MKKLYIIRKYIYAKSAREAIKKDSKHNVDDVWVDDDWKKSHTDDMNGKDFNLNKK